MSKRTWLAFVVGALIAAPAAAVPISITNTGIDVTANRDNDWDIAVSTFVHPGGSSVPAATLAIPGAGVGSDAWLGVTIPAPWLVNNGVSQWISPVGPNADQQLSPTQTYYIYSTSFALPTTDGAQLDGRWASDNQTYGIYLNGSLITGFGTNCTDSTTQNSCFNSWSTLPSITSGFLAGSNTLSFVVFNYTGPSGLRVEVSGSYDESAPIPEPGTLLLLGSGLTALAARRRRRV